MTQAAQTQPTLWLPGEGEHTAYMGSYFGLWSIEPSHITAALDYLREVDVSRHIEQVRLSGGSKSAHSVTQIRLANGHGPGPAPEQTIAVIGMHGTLMKRASSLEESTSMIAVRREIRSAAADPMIDGIMLVIDSPGGTVDGTEDLSNEIRSAGQQKPLWVHVQDCLCSGAFWIGMQGARITANARTADIGSIGVLTALYDRSGEAKMKGVEAIVIATGENKGVGFPGRPVSDSDRAMLQKRVDRTAAVFREAIEHRVKGETLDRLMASAEVIDAAEAVELGIIDGIESFEQALSAMFEHLKDHQGGNMNANRGTFDGANVKIDLSAAGDGAGQTDAPQTSDQPDGGDAKPADQNQHASGDGRNAPAGGEQAHGQKEGQATDATSAAASNDGEAVTLEWLEAKCTKASADFRLQCLRDGLTKEQASERYIAQLQADAEKEREARENAEQRLAAAGLARDMSGGEAVDVGAGADGNAGGGSKRRTDPIAAGLMDAIHISGSARNN